MSQHEENVPRHEAPDARAAGEHIMDSHGHEHHIVPVSLYVKVIVILMVLLIITLGAAAVDFSQYGPALAPLNIVIAMTIAIIKAVIIILYFMHVRFSSKLVWVFAGAAFYWVIILFVLTLTDYMSRSMTYHPGQYTF